MSNSSTKHSIWDLPTRLFHWLIALAVALAWFSAEYQYYELHEYTGYAVIVLVLARVVWGFIGSKHSRFADFVRRPGEVLAYVCGKNLHATAGHNPLGGWSVILMITVLLVQALSGLFNSDDILFNGPFYAAVDSQWQDRMGVVHDLTFNILLSLIGMHVLAVAWHQRQGDDLLGPMLQGKTVYRYSRSAVAPLWPWLLTLAILALVLWQAIEQAPKPQSQWF